MLDPDAALYIERLRSSPPLNQLGVEGARAAARARRIAPDSSPGLQVQDMHAQDGASAVPLRIYRQDSREVLPAILYMHAGGWVLGDLDHSDALCRVLAKKSRCVVISIDYRLAPEHPFPRPLEDCAIALSWVVREAKALCVDPSRIAVAGESSGAHLAAALALKCRDEALPGPALQALSCPALDPGMATASWAAFGEGYSPAREQMGWMWRLLLPQPEDEDQAYAVPPRTKDLSGLPPAIILTAEYDPLRDEGEDYADKLARSGVSVECTRYAGHVHAFLNLGGVVPSAVEALHSFAERIGSALRAPHGSGGGGAPCPQETICEESPS